MKSLFVVLGSTFYAAAQVHNLEENGYKLFLKRDYQPEYTEEITNIQMGFDEEYQEDESASVQIETSDALVDVINLENVQYMSEICIGNPPQRVKAIFDTGSSNMLVFQKGAYDSRISQTVVQTAEPVHAKFGSGAIQGHFIVDQIRLGQDCSKNVSQIVVNNQKFGLAEKIQGFQYSQFEAIIGLAYPAMSRGSHVPQFFDNLVAQGQLTKKVFAFYMASNFEEKMLGLKSEMTLGYYDKSKFEGDIQWNPVLFKYMYAIKLDAVKVNGTLLDLGCDKRECLISVDTGTSHLVFPSFAIAKSKHLMPSKQGTLPCDSEQDFGSISFIINGKEYPIPNNDWMFDAEPVLNQKKKNCRSVIIKRDLRREMFVLGDIFIRNYYTVFDRDNDKVGLAKKKLL